MTIHVIINLLFLLYALSIYRKKRFDFFDIHILSFWITTFMYHTIEYYYNEDLFDNDFIYLSFVIAGIYFFLIWILKTYFLKEAMLSVSERIKVLETITPRTNFLVMLSWQLFIIGVYLTYGYVFKGTSSYDMDVSYAVSSLLKLAPIFVMATWAVFVARGELRLSRYNVSYLLFFLPSLFIFVFFMGRRTIFYFFLLTALILLERINYRLNLRQAFLVGLMFLSLPTLFDAYQSVRQNPYDRNIVESTTSDDYEDKVEGLKEIATAQDEYRTTAESLLTRGTPITLLHDIVRNTETSGLYAEGAVLWNAIQGSIPRALYWEKPEVWAAEGIIERETGLPLTDSANMYLSEMYADFGFIGILVAIAIVIFVPFFLFSLNKAIPFPLTSLYCFGASYLFLVQIEATVNGFLATLRNAFIFVLLDALLYLLGIYGKKKSLNNEAPA